jgi:Zn ribbon nucleic-acid-binding protein
MFQIVLGGALILLLLSRKAKADGASCVCPACAGQGAIVLVDDAGSSCGNAECVACAGTGQTLNPDLNRSGRYDSTPPMEVDLCGLLADARAGDMNARAMVDGLLSQGRIVQGDLAACRTSPALSTEKSTVMADGTGGFSVLGSDAVLDTRTAGGAGLTVLPAVNAVSPVLPSLNFGPIQPTEPLENVCGLVRATAKDDREAAGQLRMMLDNGMIRITDLDRCKLDLSASDQLRVTKMVVL